MSFTILANSCSCLVVGHFYKNNNSTLYDNNRGQSTFIYYFHVSGPVVSEGREPRARAPLPEIVHQFRAAEARPARAVSDVFAACCAAPLLLLLVMWARLAPALRMPPLHLALLFHLALGGTSLTITIICPHAHFTLIRSFYDKLAVCI